MHGDWRPLLERAVLVVGVVCLGWYGLVSVEAKYREQRTRDAIELAVSDIVLPPEASDADETLDANLVGMLEIPRLRMSTPIVEGDHEEALRGAAGHLPDTPQPWEAGNSAIAAHRDGLFRPLEHIRVGDDVRVRTRRGELRYTVRSTRIVKPTDLSVLAQSEDQALTLITCYPFAYVGSAPKRFIVRAERVPTP